MVLFDRRFDLYHFGLILYQMCNGLNEYYRQKDSFGTKAAFLKAIVNGSSQIEMFFLCIFQK